IGERRVSLRKSHATRISQFGHFSEARALQALREGADRIHARAVQRLRAKLKHFHEARLVERRIRIGRACKAGDSTRYRSFHFRFERCHIFETGLAQACREVDESWT